MKKYLSIALFIVWISNASMVSAQFSLEDHSWIGMKPLEYNPSFAGSTGANRIVGSGALSNDRSHIINGDLSYDNFIPKISSGVGITVSTSIYRKNKDFVYFFRNGLDASLVLSPKISLKGKYTIAPSFEFTYGYSTASTNQANIPVEFPGEFHSYHARTGIMFNSKKMYLGYTASFHLGSSANVYRGHYYKKQYHSFQAGYKFQKSIDSKFSFTPQAALILGWTKLDYPYYPDEEIPEPTSLRINLNFRYKKIIWGIGNRLAMLGYQTDKLKIMYTHNWVEYVFPNVSKFYAGELSVRLLIPKKNKALDVF